MGAVGLIEGLPDGSGDDSMLTTRDMGQGVAHPVDATALPGCFEDPGDGGFEACMRVADDQSDAPQAANAQGSKELGPECLGLGRADTEADDLTASLGVGGHGDYCGDWYDPSALAHLQIGGVEPEDRAIRR